MKIDSTTLSVFMARFLERGSWYYVRKNAVEPLKNCFVIVGAPIPGPRVRHTRNERDYSRIVPHCRPAVDMPRGPAPSPATSGRASPGPASGPPAGAVHRRPEAVAVRLPEDHFARWRLRYG